MFKKKDLDINTIVKNSFVQANKEHGFINEADVIDKQASEPNQLAFNEPFSAEKHLQFMQIMPEKWGLKGTVDASQLDTVISSVTGNGKGIANFKAVLSKLNSILGKTPNNVSLPTSDNPRDLTANALNVFSSLQLNSLFHSIIYAQDASVAGKMYEGLVSRIVGGSVNLTDSIQDLIDDQGNYISLKLIDPGSTTIQGSFYNLAVGLASLPPDKGITYLVCTKSTKDNPFSFKTFSFKINRNNYFNFLLKNPGQLKKEDIQDAGNRVITNDPNLKVGAKTPKGQKDVTSQETSSTKFVPKEYTSDESFISQALTSYAQKKLGTTSDDEIVKFIKSTIDSNNDLIGNSNDEFSKLIGFPVKAEFWENYLSPMRLKKVASEGKKAVTASEYSRFRNAIKTFSNILKDSSKKLELLENDPTILAALENSKKDGTYDEVKKTTLVKRINFYNEQFLKIQNYLNPIINLDSAIEKIISDLSSEKLQASRQIGSQFKKLQSSNEDVTSLINQFFNNVKDTNNFSQKKKSPQLDISIEQAKHLALETDGDYDEDYEEFIVEGGVLFNNAQRSNETLKQFIIPIFEANHNMLNGLKSYYMADQIYGMIYAKENVEVLKNEIQSEQSKNRTASQAKLQENKTNKPLTKSWSDDILEWVQNLK